MAKYFKYLHQFVRVQHILQQIQFAIHQKKNKPPMHFFPFLFCSELKNSLSIKPHFALINLSRVKARSIVVFVILLWLKIALSTSSTNINGIKKKSHTNFISPQLFNFHTQKN